MLLESRQPSFHTRSQAWAREETGSKYVTLHASQQSGRLCTQAGFAFVLERVAPGTPHLGILRTLATQSALDRPAEGGLLEMQALSPQTS